MTSVFVFFIWACVVLFALRVLGQIYQAIYHVEWLPPMAEWHSGILPYYLLLPSQMFILVFMSLVAYDFSRREGQLFVVNPQTGRILIVFSLIYFASMIIRYTVRMMRRPDQRWLGGTIPIIFHCVLALFLFLCGYFQWLSV